MLIIQQFVTFDFVCKDRLHSVYFFFLVHCCCFHLNWTHFLISQNESIHNSSDIVLPYFSFFTNLKALFLCVDEFRSFFFSTKRLDLPATDHHLLISAKIALRNIQNLLEFFTGVCKLLKSCMKMNSETNYSVSQCGWKIHQYQ